ncbi:hypothetical protein [Balneatrix alpica]|uniref:hypothetical protein n=1 Tax=Balneatrix alpica TaxID=75684 RepID=UPI002739E7C0|nr:hypothetical protein [Balneatrix alpica]
MKKWLGVGALAIAAGAGLGWQQGWFKQWLGADALPLEAYAPADTFFYVGGTPHPQLAENLDKLPLGLSQMDLQEIRTLLQQEQPAEPSGRFLHALLLDLLNHLDRPSQLVERYGLDLSRSQAFFMDGLYPVIKMPVNNEQNFWQAFNQFSQDSDLQPQQSQLDHLQVSRWRLLEQQGEYLDMAVTLEQGLATLTLLSNFDNDAQVRQRLGLVRPVTSLQESSELAQMRKDYGFSEEMILLFHLERLTRLVLQPDSSPAAQQLQQLLSRAEINVNQDLTPACRQEIIGLISQTPRIVGGYYQSEFSPQGYRVDSEAVLEIKHEPTRQALAKLRGHLPSHTLQAEPALFSLGFGTDINNLVPATTELWKAFTEAKFDCAELVELQQASASLSPAYLGMATGMMQGIKGIGFSLYGLQLDQQNPFNSKLDALLSIASDNPGTLISMLAASPFGQGIQIPQDGSLGEVDLSMLLPGLTMKAGIQGQHLVAALGPQAEQQASTLQQEKLEINGLSSVSVDVTKLTELVASLPARDLSDLSGLEDDLADQACIEQASLVHDLRQMPVQAVVKMDITGKGWSTRSQQLTQFQQTKLPELAGRYQLFNQSDDCQSQDVVGEEQIGQDGKGLFLGREAGLDCDTSRISYQWRQQGSRLLMENGQFQGRDSCDGEWDEQIAYNASCQIINIDAKGFQCLYNEEGEISLYRYQRLQ